MSTPEDAVEDAPFDFQTALGDAIGAANAPEGEPPASEEPAAAGPGTDASDPGSDAGAQGDPSAPEDLPEWRRYGFKDEESMWNSYKELQRTLTQRTQAPAEEVEEEPEPQAPTWQSHNFQSLGEIPRVGLSHQQRTELSDLMQVDPKAAALWALQNQEYMDAGDYKAVQNNWAAQDPYEYNEFRDALREHQAQQARDEAEAGRSDYVLNMQRTDAINGAKQKLPLMEERADEFGAWLEAPENKPVSTMLDQIADPARLEQALISAFYQFAGPQLYQELVQGHQAAAAAEAERQAQEQLRQQQDKASRRGQTQTRSSAEAVTDTSDADDMIRNLIGNPHRM